MWASQRDVSALWDLFYDLGGSGSGYYVSVAVSTNGGSSFSLPASSFTGDGIGFSATPGANRHIIWDARADFPGHFSTKMRLMLVVIGWPSAVSPIFTLDTRTVSAGTLTGLVQGNGTPIANAQVRIDGTPDRKSTRLNSSHLCI